MIVPASGWESYRWNGVDKKSHTTIPCTQDSRFPGGLSRALPLSADEVAALRSVTGSADDLETYVPELRVADVARASPIYGRCEWEGACKYAQRASNITQATRRSVRMVASHYRLCEWLLTAELHGYAQHELEAAQAWQWPTHVG